MNYSGDFIEAGLEQSKKSKSYLSENQRALDYASVDPTVIDSCLGLTIPNFIDPGYRQLQIYFS